MAKDEGGVAVLDESIAREVGRIFKIEVHGTMFLIFLMVRMGKLGKIEAKAKMDLMINKGFRLGHEQYLEFLNLLDCVETKSG